MTIEDPDGWRVVLDEFPGYLRFSNRCAAMRRTVPLAVINHCNLLR